MIYWEVFLGICVSTAAVLNLRQPAGKLGSDDLTSCPCGSSWLLTRCVVAGQLELIKDLFGSFRGKWGEGKVETRSEQDGLPTELRVLNPPRAHGLRPGSAGSFWQQRGQGVPPASRPAGSPPAAAAGDAPLSTPAAVTNPSFSVKSSDGNAAWFRGDWNSWLKKGWERDACLNSCSGEKSRSRTRDLAFNLCPASDLACA